MKNLRLFLLLLLAAPMPAAGDQPREVTLFFTGYVRGNFEPCG